MSYDAFVSYSHTADNIPAAALQAALHRFAKPWYKLRAVHIFRDQTNLAINPALWSSIRDALDQSLFFILLASPEAAASAWVAKEAEYWIGRNGPSHILIVLTGGALKWNHSAAAFTSEDTNALPPCLLRAFPEEPLYLDLRWVRNGAPRLSMREPRFHEAVLELASTLHNRPKDELDGTDIRLQRETRLLAASGLIVILLIALFALRQTRLGRDESIQNRAASLAANSRKVLADNPDRAGEAALLAVESNRLAPSFEGNQALRAAVSLLPAAAQFYAPPDANPSERIRALAFSPDGARLAAARDDGSTQLIDFKNHQQPIDFAPDDRPAASIELASGPQGASADDNAAVSVAFNSTGSLLASGARDGIAHIWTLPGAREVLRVVDAAAISQIAFHPKANQIVAASDDGHVRVFDVARAATVADVKCSGKIVAAAFSPDGSLIAALSSDGEVSLLDPVHSKVLRTMTGGEAGFNLAFSSDGKRLAVASGDFAFVWDVSTGRQLLRATHAAGSETLTPQQWIYSAAISADGKFLAYAARGNEFAHVWSVDTGRQILELKHSTSVAAVAFNADGTKLGTGSFDGTARVWELPAGNELERTAHPGGAEVLLFSPNGSHFAAGGMDGSISVSETHRADRPAYFAVPSQVRSVAFSPDGKRVAIGTVSAHWFAMVRVAETGGNVLRDIEVRGPPVIDKLYFLNPSEVIAQWSSKLYLIAVDKSSVTLLPDIPGERRIDPYGKIFAIQEGGGITKLYTLPGQQQSASLATSASALVRPAAEGKLVAFETSKPPKGFFIDVWSVASKTRISRVQIPAELNRLAINSSGTVLFTAESENLQAWDLPSGKPRFSLTASGDIDAIVPDPSSASFATITHGHLTLWEGVKGTRLAELPDAGFLDAAAFSPDGRYLLAGYQERSAALWLWRSADLRDQACGRLTGNLSRAQWTHWFPKEPYRKICANLPAGN
jgi:WD40 repeat protein